MRRLLAPAAAATVALLAGRAFALPPEPASAPKGALRGARVAPAPPAAVGGVPGLTPNANSNAPIDITSEGVEVIQPERLTIFKGNVEVINDTTRLRTPELRVFYKPKQATPGQAPAASNSPFGADQTGGIDHIIGAGPVYYITPTQNARGDALLYEADPNIITMTGHVVLVQGKSVARGDKLIMYRKTGQNELTSDAPQDPHQRVRVILYPQQQAAPGAPKPPAG